MRAHLGFRINDVGIGVVHDTIAAVTAIHFSPGCRTRILVCAVVLSTSVGFGRSLKGIPHRVELEGH